MEIWKEPGESGKAYHVFDSKTNKNEAIAEAARHQKIARAKMEAITVYIKGDDLYLEKVKGGKKALAVVRKAGA